MLKSCQQDPIQSSGRVDLDREGRMRSNWKIAAIVLSLLAPVTVSLAASNKDRVGFGSSRKTEDQHPQATETKQYCTELSTRVQPGRAKERVQDDAAAQACQNVPATRSSEEVRSEYRKVERNPNN